MKEGTQFTEQPRQKERRGDPGTGPQSPGKWAMLYTQGPERSLCSGLFGDNDFRVFSRYRKCGGAAVSYAP